MAAATGSMAPGASASLAIAWHYGVNMIPDIAALTAQIEAWVRIWTERDSTDKHTIRKVWQDIAFDAKRAHDTGGINAMWRQVRSPMSATIATLIEHGVKPISPDAWIAPHGVLHHEGGRNEVTLCIEETPGGGSMPGICPECSARSKPHLQRPLLAQVEPRQRCSTLRP